MAPTIGTPTSRVDGRAKVTGHAKYAAEFNAPDLVHGAVVSSTITKGRIAHIDVSHALAFPGVLDVVTHDNRPDMASTDKGYHDDVAPEGGSPFRPLFDDQIRFNGQPVALVLAEDFETATFAATLVNIEYEKDKFTTELEARRQEAHVIEKPHKPRGDAAKAFAKAAVRHEAEYVIPREYHNPMELFGATVVWDGGGRLTIYDKTQGVQNVQRYICGVFALKPDDVRVISPYVGGAFGSGLRPQYEVALATLGALKLKRSVRLMLTRAQMYGLSYRPETIERIALGANSGGTLDAITYEAIAMTSQYEDFSRTDGGWAEQLYASANARYAHKLASLDVATPGDMRAPGAATGVYALESAMDELAVALKLDPMELRLRCYSDRDQVSGLPYSSKQLKACYQQGAEAFGWARRSARAAFDARRQRAGWMGHGVRCLGGAADAVLDADRADGERPRRGVFCGLGYRHRHLHHHGADRSRHARRVCRQREREARGFDACRRRRSKAGRGPRRPWRMRSSTRPTTSRKSCCRSRRRCRAHRSKASSSMTSCWPMARSPTRRIKVAPSRLRT